jgi:hypothetical protein
MKGTSAKEAIPEDVALRLCEVIRKEKSGRPFTQCWGCVKFSKGDLAKLCLRSRPDYRGCKLVNERYDRTG